MNLLQFILSNYQVVETEIVDILLNDTKEEGYYESKLTINDNKPGVSFNLDLIKDNQLIFCHETSKAPIAKALSNYISEYNTTREESELWT